jgi:hypothetical protein
VLELLLLLHAAIVRAAATAVATMAGFLVPRMRSHLLTMPRDSLVPESATGRASWRCRKRDAHPNDARVLVPKV